MHASLRIGRVAGVEIGVNWSWLVIFGLISWSLGAAIFPESNPGLGDGAYVAMAVVAAVLFFGSLLLHELGHAVVAQREGMEIEGIVLWLFGGVAQFKGLFPSANAELRIALAGPAVSLAIGVAMLALGALAPLPPEIDGVVTWLGGINILLLVFNMLPALPLDGGRVLRALLWRASGDFTRATRTAGGLGQAFGQAMIFGGILLLFLTGAVGGLWLALIGWFLFAAAGAEARMATIAAALRPLRVSDAMARRPETAAGDMTLAGFANGVFADSRHAAYPVLDGPEVLGAVSYRDVAAVAPEDWGLTRVRDVARPVGELLVLAPDDNLGDAATSLAQDDLGRALVLDQGALAGLLSMTDVARLIELRAPARSSRRDRRAIAAPVRDLPAQPDVRDHARDRR
jgi:Zn-dependent protease/CBS domain-containing protein